MILVNATGAALIAVVVLYLGVAHGASVGYFAPLDDFWGNAFAANNWAWSAKAQWNGFFPPGYPTLLYLLPGGRLVESAFYLNLASGLALLLVVWGSTRRLSGQGAAIAAMALVATHPVVLTQALTTGADALLVTLAVAGALALFHAVSGEPNRPWLAIGGGVLLAAAGWVRYHGFVFGVGALAAALAVGGRPARRSVIAGAAPMALAGLGLLALGLAAGDLASVQRAQAFNLYKGLVASVNWFHLDAANLPTSVGEAIARDPAAFRRNYLAFSAPHLWLALPLVVAVAVSKGRSRRFAFFAAMCSAVFVPIVNLGASPRGVAAVVPLILMASSLAAVDGVRRIAAVGRRRFASGALVTVTTIYAGLVWLPQAQTFVADTRARALVSMAIESRLREEQVRIGAQVFTDNDFYLVHSRGWQVATYHPRSIGGWPSLDMFGYLESYPEPSTSSLDRFLDDCHQVGVTHLVLTAAAGFVQPDLGRLFDGSLTTVRVAEVPAIPGVRIFRLVG